MVLLDTDLTMKQEARVQKEEPGQGSQCLDRIISYLQFLLAICVVSYKHSASVIKNQGIGYK